MDTLDKELHRKQFEDDMVRVEQEKYYKKNLRERQQNDLTKFYDEQKANKKVKEDIDKIADQFYTNE